MHRVLVAASPAAVLAAPDAPAPGERLWPATGDDAPVVVAREGDDVVVRTALGEVAIAAAVADDATNADAFRRALERIGGLAAGDGARPRFARAALTGLRLQAGDALVVDEGVLRAATIAE